MEKISALVITYNEIEYIEQCIGSLSFADEIIVVDSFSTDGTFELLQKNPKVKSVQRKFCNFSDQKQFTLSLASYDWIYFIDADEFISPDLKDEIIHTINSENAKDAYFNKRIFMYQNKPVFFSGTQTDKQYRLFRKSKCNYDQIKTVHEVLKVDGTSGYLKNKLIHFSFRNYENFKQKLIRYAKLKGEQRFNEQGACTLAHLILKPIWKFFFNYIFRLGILDGKRGLNICYLNALGVYHRYLHMRRLKHNSSSINNATKE